MKKSVFFLFLLSGIISTANAQWDYTNADIYNTNFGYVGIGTTTPRSQLEVRHSARISPSSSASGFFFDGSNLSTSDNWSNVRLIAGSASGSGWLKNYLDNYGGYFSWAVNSPGNIEREIMRLNADNGNLGIGVVNPQSKLDVRGGYVSTRNNDNLVAAFMEGGNNVCYFGALGATMVSVGNSAAWQILNITPGGDVGIGTTDPKFKLAVNGSIGAKKVKVTMDDWADYVFQPGYRLPALKEVEQFILANRHLPGIASAANVKEDGLDLGDNQAAMLAKIEELTLYAIEQDKKITSQQAELNGLKTELASLRKTAAEIGELKAMVEQIKNAQSVGTGAGKK